MNSTDILALRKSQGLTQVEFAHTWGLNFKTYRDWEGGAREPKQGALLWLMTVKHHPVAAAKIVAIYRKKGWTPT